MKVFRPSVLALALLGVLCASLSFARSGDPAHLRIDPPQWDFGKISSSQIVRHTFLLWNTGASTLYIRDLTVTCGCTVVDVSTRSIDPGKSASLTVRIEPDAKEGLVEKSVTIATNDPDGPLRTVTVRAQVQRDLHAMSSLAKEKSIFSQECRSCHVDRGMGKKGKELYAADCSMCHGSLEEKDHVRALNGPRLAEDLEDLRALIAQGNGRGSMPGFSKAAGGPLDDAEIDSLVDLFRHWEKTEKTRHSKRR